MRKTPSQREILLLAALYLVVALVGTWPVASDPATRSLASLTDNDFRLNIYLIFWGAHALVTDPLGLHHTNMFHPERYTFAYGDIMLAHSLLALPVILAGGGPHLVYNLLLIAVLTLGPLGFYLLARDLLAGFGRRTAVAAALVGGLIYAWNPAHFTRYQQIQFLGDHWMPWFAWAMLHWLRLTPVPGPGETAADAGVRRTGWAATAAAFLCLHALSGSHNAVFGALLAGVATFHGATVRGLWTDAGFWKGLGVIVVLCVIALGPIFYPYLIVEDRAAGQRDQTREELLHGSAAPLELLSARSIAGSRPSSGGPRCRTPPGGSPGPTCFRDWWRCCWRASGWRGAGPGATHRRASFWSSPESPSSSPWARGAVCIWRWNGCRCCASSGCRPGSWCRRPSGCRSWRPGGPPGSSSAGDAVSAPACSRRSSSCSPAPFSHRDRCAGWRWWLPPTVARMTAAMAPRGPDGAGLVAQEHRHLLGVHRAAEQESLHQVAVALAQEVQRVGREVHLRLDARNGLESFDHFDSRSRP